MTYFDEDSLNNRLSQEIGCWWLLQLHDTDGRRKKKRRESERVQDTVI